MAISISIGSVHRLHDWEFTEAEPIKLPARQGGGNLAYIVAWPALSGIYRSGKLRSYGLSTGSAPLGNSTHIWPPCFMRPA